MNGCKALLVLLFIRAILLVIVVIHYTCYFKDQYQNQWFYANDSHVSVIVVKILLVQK